MSRRGCCHQRPLLQDFGKCCEAGNGRSLVTSMFWRPLQLYPCFISLVPMSLTPSMLSFLTQELQKGLWQRVGADAVPGTDGLQIGSGFLWFFSSLALLPPSWGFLVPWNFRFIFGCLSVFSPFHLDSILDFVVSSLSLLLSVFCSHLRLLE